MGRKSYFGPEISLRRSARIRTLWALPEVGILNLGEVGELFRLTFSCNVTVFSWPRSSDDVNVSQSHLAS